MKWWINLIFSGKKLLSGLSIRISYVIINVYRICYSRQRQTCLLQQHAPCLCLPGADVRLGQREHVQGLMWRSSLTPSPRGVLGSCVTGLGQRVFEGLLPEGSAGCWKVTRLTTVTAAWRVVYHHTSSALPVNCNYSNTLTLSCIRVQDWESPAC